ncbi:MAG: glutamyl-tRNA amidotransferase [Candidatus Levybacteria bacterium RIFCSPHIGHO2_02_FULL_40_18]|nr:MAG: glutamyl-tRNA amidotransferase [Candidatus Levybacteria bacterium RIFCSPHIGHO2_01_FULL_40_58]OGH26482.1 MAG: glutamyl-tRNA amidotransferase [Candidatus Levybacteria bacterium RIFCSPHIGHO2_02_FULL_40_18]OGH31930.1 MAG: glutamyl-tRNA amidotransferase [Candidatus Levybacteria bacterium RIFCSPHIGHO2_12_FULL_40_31]OGH40199.1 MAG: glutamyl-tRNA amidotransferase [Candidatus Levybacteria bacterium RIFCSPLOWO2_01_FULL_40_64]OGH49323.1 MAG: glutamyl-tRNA amidotransferase [Candidatus Levybacteria 
MLKDKIQEDLKQAMVAKDELRLSTIRLLKSAIQYHEIQKGGAGYGATDEDVIEVIGREIKKRNEAIELYKQGGRNELAEKEQKELEILKSYLPEQMSEDEVRKLVEEAISSIGASGIQDMGKVMGALMPKVKGKADGTLVSNIVREALSS